MSVTNLAIETPFGPIQIAWSIEPNIRVQRIWLPQDANAPTNTLAPSQPPAAIADLSECIQRFLQGEAVTLSLEHLALDTCSPFQQAVLLAERAIPRGMVSTYGLIAQHLGMPKAARAVGRALATNPFPLVIPCHRAVRGNGEMGGFQGGLAMKQSLLQLEGQRFDAKGRLVKPHLYYS